MDDATTTVEGHFVGRTALTAVPRPLPLTTAELAECTCPDRCERDHDRD